MRVIIVGAGICGLGTAIALDRVGIDSVVLEKAPGSAGEGAAITVWNNGLQALARLQLRPGYLSIFEPIEVVRVVTSAGKHLGDVPVARLASAFGPGAAMVYRPELATLLAEHLKPGQIQFDSELVAVESEAQGITAVLADGRRIGADLLIGADGIRATTKRFFATADLTYCKHMAWRGTTEFEHPFFAAGTSFSVVGKAAYFVAHHLTGGRFYWIGTRSADEPQRLERSQWKSDARQWFSGWIEPVRALIEATPESAILVNDIFSCTTPDYSARRNSLLLGDAAHASAPQLGQGACLALEDAVVFADCLRRADWPASAETFVGLRLDRVERVVAKSQRLADIYHLRTPVSVWLRNTALRAAPGSMRLKRAGWAAKITLPTLNQS